jgi:uncharacterized membrane protein (UPF0127 family)
LVVVGRVVCDVEVAATAGERRRGLSGRDGIDGALLIPRCPGVHTFGMRFPVDVAYLDRDLVVVDVLTMVPSRPGRLRLRARSVLEAEATAFVRWGLQRGGRLELRDDEEES